MLKRVWHRLMRWDSYVDDASLKFSEAHFLCYSQPALLSVVNVIITQ